MRVSASKNKVAFKVKTRRNPGWASNSKMAVERVASDRVNILRARDGDWAIVARDVYVDGNNLRNVLRIFSALDDDNLLNF